MRSQHLNIDPVEPGLFQVVDHIQKRQFRGVGLEMKHAFAGEGTARINAVHPAYEKPIAPRFHAMRVTQAVELRICHFHLRRDPSAVLTGTRDDGAKPDDVGKRPIDRKTPTLAPGSASCLSKASWNMEEIELENCPRVRRKPEQWVVWMGPGEDPLAVRQP